MEEGVLYSATDKSGSFMDVLNTSYALKLRERAGWLLERFKEKSDQALTELIRKEAGDWGLNLKWPQL